MPLEGERTGRCAWLGAGPRREESPGREAVQVQQGVCRAAQQAQGERGAGPRQHPVGGLEGVGATRKGQGHPRLRGRLPPLCPARSAPGRLWPPARPEGPGPPGAWRPGHPGLQLPQGLLCPLPPYTIQGLHRHLQVAPFSVGPGALQRQPPPPEASQAWRQVQRCWLPPRPTQGNQPAPPR